jgi:hypothetical protein
MKGAAMSFSKLCGLCASAVLALSLAGAAYAQSAGGAPGGGAPAGQAGGGPGGGQGLGYNTGANPDAAGPSGGQRTMDVPILYVTGIEVLHSQMDPKIDIIRVTGVTSSAGWTNPQLVPFFYGRPTDDIIDLQFIAGSPEQSQKADGFVPISATFTLDGVHPFKGVRIRAYGNALELKQMSGGTATYQVKAIDCKECIGRKYVEKGQGQAGPGIIYAGDLPPDHRPIGPTHGVKGQVHNPNRINLILDGDNKIVMAFWE